MTKTEARKLARRGKSFGHYVVDNYRIEIVCPLSMQSGERSHRVTVTRNLLWEGFTAKLIEDAFIDHYLTPYADERCSHAGA